MKTQRRHELQQNTLADLLGTWILKVQPYWRVGLGVIILAVAGFAAVGIVRARQEARAAHAWASYMEAAASQDPERLLAVATEYGDAPAGHWAWQSVGDIRLAEGSRLLFVDREEALEQLEQATKAYEFVQQHATEVGLKQRAAFGLAQVHEAKNDLQRAAELYQHVVETWPGTAIAEEADQRLAFVNDSSTREFYDWFYKQEITPTATGTGATGSTNLQDLPSLPNIQLPTTGSAPSADGGPPAAGDTQPADVPPPDFAPLPDLPSSPAEQSGDALELPSDSGAAPSDPSDVPPLPSDAEPDAAELPPDAEVDSAVDEDAPLEPSGDNPS